MHTPQSVSGKRHQLLCKYGVLAGLYPTKTVERASPVLELDEDLQEIIASEATITLASAARQALTLRISVSCTVFDGVTGHDRKERNIYIKRNTSPIPI